MQGTNVGCLEEDIDRALAKADAAELIAKVRQIQDSSSWREKLHVQYTAKVSKRTLELNRMFPIDDR